MLKIALLVDGNYVPKWVNTIIESLQQMPTVKICLVIVNDSPPQPATFNRFFSTIIYRTLRFVDKKLLPVADDPFKRESVRLKGKKVLQVRPLRTKYSDRFPLTTISEIKDEQLDILIRFGFRILRGEILTVAKYGIFSLHHGSMDTYRGGPPAFWEVVNKEPTTEVSLQLLTEELDGGVLLGKCRLRTDTNSFYRNHVKACWAGVELMLGCIYKLAVGETNLSEKSASPIFYTHPLYTKPGSYKCIKILFNWSMSNAYRKIRSVFLFNQWGLLYAVGKNSPQTAFYRYKKLRPPADRIWADPFVIERDGIYFVFFEELYNKSSKAHISYLQFDGKQSLQSLVPVKVLEEKHHLSYPFVFQHADSFFMIPESAAAGELNLYIAEDFPFKWKKIKTLMSGIHVYDATLYEHENVFYLFCTAKTSKNLSSDVYLHIFFCRDLLNEEFKSHPMNPIYRDVTNARPAGKLFKHRNMLFRPAQICAPLYGTGIKLNLVTKLSTTEFEEKEYTQLTANWNKSLSGMHTYNYTEGFSVADYQALRGRWS